MGGAESGLTVGAPWLGGEVSVRDRGGDGGHLAGGGVVALQFAAAGQHDVGLLATGDDHGDGVATEHFRPLGQPFLFRDFELFLKQ